MSTGHRAPVHKGHLPTARLWEPKCRGRAHRPRLPSRPAHGGPHGTPSQAVNSGPPYLEGEPTGLFFPPGWPWSPHSTPIPSLPGLCPETGDPGQNQPPSHGVSGELRPAREQSQPAGHGWQSFHDVAPGTGRRKPVGPTLWPTTGGPPGGTLALARFRLQGCALLCPLDLPDSARCVAPPCLIIHLSCRHHALSLCLCHPPPCSGLPQSPGPGL